MKVRDLADKVVTDAQKCGLTVACAESCTAGALALALSKAPGAATQFHGSFVTYTKAMKTSVLGVSAALLREKSAVCREVAEAMAAGVLEKSPADLAVAITGVVGPEPDEDGNPVGLICCAAAKRGAPPLPGIRIEMPRRSREAIVEQALLEALTLLRNLCVPEQVLLARSPRPKERSGCGS